MIDDKIDGFMELTKIKANELGISLKDEVLNLLRDSVGHFHHIVGVEPIMATFGPILQQLLFDEVKRKVLGEDVSELGKKLETKFEQLNHNFIKSGFGRKLFQDIILEILNENEKSKRDALKNFLISSYSLQTPDEIFLSQSLTRLSQMTSLHLQILAIIDNPLEAVKTIFQKKKMAWVEYQGGSRTAIRIEILNDLSLYLNVDDTLYRNVLQELHTWGLISDVDGPKGGYFPEGFEQGIMSMSDGTKNVMTSWGNSFVKLIKSL